MTPSGDAGPELLSGTLELIVLRTLTVMGPQHAYGIAARLNVNLPGMDRAAAQALVDAAHQVCPYSNATRGNIDVTITLV